MNSVRKKYLKELIIFIIAFFVIFILPIIIIDNKMELYINWGIDMPRPNKVDVICDHAVGQDGEYLKIWYYNERKIEKIVNYDIFQSINEQAKIFIKEKLDEYYVTLDDNNKSLFNTNINIDTILVEENHFLFVQREKDTSWLLLVLDCKNNKMFSFEDFY